MSKGTRRASRAPAAGWSPPRDLGPEGKAFTATHPALHLLVWCNFTGVQVVAHVDHLDSNGRLHRITIAKASFRPPEVSERLVVEWGRRALESWLTRTLTPPGDDA